MDLYPLYISAKLAVATTIFIPVVAAPIAFLLAFLDFRGKSLVDAVVSLPMVLPPTVLGFGLLIVMGPQGPLGGLWTDPDRRTHGVQFFRHPAGVTGV